MANLRGTNVAAQIVPFTDQDPFATHEDTYGKGGYRVVSTIAERNTISVERRKVLMKVSVLEDNKTYTLKTNPEGNTTNTDWGEENTAGVDIQSVAVSDNKIVITKSDNTVVESNSLPTPYIHPTTHDSSMIVGGYHEVANLAARDAIPSNVKHEGMMVTVVSDIDGTPCSYRLINAKWEPLTSSAGVRGGEFATYQDLFNLSNPTDGYNYIVTADENNNGERTYYTYNATTYTYTFIGSFYDRYSAGTVVAGGLGANAQWSSASVILPGSKKVLDLTNTPNYNFIAPTVLVEEQGSQDIVATVNEFNNGEASSFNYDSEFVEFSGGKMQLKTNFALAKTPVTTNPDCLYYRSNINISKYKNIESVVL